jgi:hypothetical protein
MAAKFFTGLPMDGPDPECDQGYGAPALAADRVKPKSSVDHSRSQPVMLKLMTSPPRPNVGAGAPPARLCNESPV